MVRRTFAVVLAVLICVLSCAFSASAETEPAAASSGFPIILGDADGDNVIDIKDVTAVQRYVAQFTDANGVYTNLGDADRDNELTIGDATEIARWLCEFKMPKRDLSIGEPVGEYLDDYAEEVLKLVNEERAKENLDPLVMDEGLVRVAKIRGLEISWPGHFSHTRPDGSVCFTAADGLELWAYGENIAAGYPTPEDVMDGWMNSPGHRANILTDYFECIGIACVYTPVSNGGYAYNWVQFFGSYF